MINKEINRIQDRRLYLRMTNYGHHVRVCIKRISLLRHGRRIPHQIVSFERGKPSSGCNIIQWQVPFTRSEESKGTFAGVSVGFREFQLPPSSVRIDVMYFTER